MFRTNYSKPFSLTNIPKSRSTDNFYLRAAEKSLRNVPTLATTEPECLACKHEQSKLTLPLKQGYQYPSLYTSKSPSKQEYYATNDKNELTHLRRSKKYLEELL